MLVNVEKRRVLSSMHPSLASISTNSVHSKDGAVSANNTRGMNSARKLDILRTFYRNTVGAIFLDAFIPSPHAIDQNGGMQ